MKKIFLALMAVAAIAMTSCDINKPDKPNQGNNNENQDPKPQDTKTVKAVIALGVSEDWLKIADLCIYDSITGEAAKPETLSTLYSDADGSSFYAKFNTEDFEGATMFTGAMIHTTLRSDNSFGVRCELKLKENFIDIIKGLDRLDLVNVCGKADEKTLAETGLRYEMYKLNFDMAKLIAALETDPTRLNANVDLVNRMMSGTYYLEDEVVSMR